MNTYRPYFSPIEYRDLMQDKNKNMAFAISYDVDKDKELSSLNIWNKKEAIINPNFLSFIIKKRKSIKTKRYNNDLHQSWEQWHGGSE